MLIETRGFLMSAGTERMLVEFGKTGYLSKARSQPDKVKQVGEKTAGQAGSVVLLLGMKSKLLNSQINEVTGNKETADIVEVCDTEFRVRPRYDPMLKGRNYNAQ
jgi:hypothetical protein